jgi:glutamate-ammonia-ligase adenylyltransferase
MGKLGGGELNFSSDVDLIYLYQSDEGQASINTDGNQAATLSSAEYFKRLSQSLTSALSDVTNEGYVYRVDLRLRPEGRIGALAHSMEASRRYYSSRATTWERLALLKAWPVAGDQDLGLEFLEEVRPFVYGLPFDAAELDDLKRIKAGIDKKMNARRQAHRNVKLGLGGIREVEFIVQSLQVAHGRLHPHVCDRNTLRALDALCEASILTAQERDELRRAYIFLRDVENKLQMVLDLQTHTIPSRRMEARSCASRLGYRDTKTSSAVDQFLSDHQGHTERVNRIFRRLFESKEPSRFSRRY